MTGLSQLPATQVVLLCWGLAIGVATSAELQIVPESPVPAVFAEGTRSIRVTLRNPADQSVRAKLGFRVYQASAATLAPIGDKRSWREVPLGPEQTVVENVPIDLPAVRAETRFQIHWFDGDSKIGALLVRVYPPGVLGSLAVLAGETGIGLLDPEGHFKGALGKASVQEVREAEDLISAEALLILIAPMEATNQPAGLLAAVKRRASAGAAVVWVQGKAQRAPAIPEAYVLDEGSGRVVIASTRLVTNFEQSPTAQLNLIRLAELAVGKTKLTWPESNSEVAAR